MKKHLFISLIFYVLFFALMALSVNFDVANMKINKIIDYNYNKPIDILSDIILAVAFLIGLAIVVGSIIDFARKKKMKEVNHFYYIFYTILILLIAAWVLFDKLIIITNKPIDVNESSFPSTHVLFSTYTIFSAIFLLKTKLQNKKIPYTLHIIGIILITLMFIFRILSGNHYVTDALAGLFLANASVFILLYFDKKVRYKK